MKKGFTFIQIFEQKKGYCDLYFHKYYNILYNDIIFHNFKIKLTLLIKYLV